MPGVSRAGDGWRVGFIVGTLAFLGAGGIAQAQEKEKGETKAEKPPEKPAEKKKPEVESPTKPASRTGRWMTMHERFLETAKKGGVDLLFLGDSITAGWAGRNKEGEGPAEVWERHYAPRHAANFGIGGDRTQHVLWRLENGEAEGIHPKVVVLMIGTNNSGDNSAAEIAEGVEAVVKALRTKLPEAKVLLLGVFPRGEKPNRTRAKLDEVNGRIAKLDDGKAVTYLDIGKRFLNEDGTISKGIMPDHLHLSRKGYRIWADAIEPTLWPMLDDAAVREFLAAGGEKKGH